MGISKTQVGIGLGFLAVVVVGVGIWYRSQGPRDEEERKEQSKDKKDRTKGKDRDLKNSRDFRRSRDLREFRSPDYDRDYNRKKRRDGYDSSEDEIEARNKEREREREKRERERQRELERDRENRRKNISSEEEQDIGKTRPSSKLQFQLTNVVKPASIRNNDPVKTPPVPKLKIDSIIPGSKEIVPKGSLPVKAEPQKKISMKNIAADYRSSHPGSKDISDDDSFNLNQELQKSNQNKGIQKTGGVSTSLNQNRRMKASSPGPDLSYPGNTFSRMSDLSNSHFMSNSSANRKVCYNIGQNSLRKLMMTDLNINLSLLFLTGKVISSMDNEHCVEFDAAKEGYLVGTATLKFKLKDVSEDHPLFLDFCGDRLYSMKINGILHPSDLIEWKNNQITLKNLRKGDNILVVNYGTKINEIQTKTLRQSFLILRNVDFVAKYFPYFLQTSIRSSFSLEISHPKDISFIYNTLTKKLGSATEESGSQILSGKPVETMAPRILEGLNQNGSFTGSDTNKNTNLEEFLSLLDGLSLVKEAFTYSAYAPVKKWLFTDLSFVFTERTLREVKSLEIPHLYEEEDGYEPKIDFKVYGFGYYNLEFVLDFSQEIIGYLEGLFGKDIPFDHVIFLVSDQNTKIESIGNILIINDLELNKLQSSPNSVIYASLTMSLFYSRIYFGNIVSYISPEEKFIVEGMRGTLALIFLQNSNILDKELSQYLNRRTKFEKLVKADGLPMGEDSMTNSSMMEDSGDLRSQLSGRTFKDKPQYLNESMFSNRSVDSKEKNMETLEINQLLNTYLIELKYKIFEIEMSKYITPLYESKVYQNKDSLDAITYHNSLAKFKMFYVLKELAIKTNQFIRAFKTLINTYTYETVSSQIFFDFLCENLSNQNLEEHELQDWFRDNFEKAGINKISSDIFFNTKRPTKIESFRIVQHDVCPLNKTNPVYRRHTTDVLMMNSDFQPMYHYDILLEPVRENTLGELKKRNMPKVVILNASENGYFLSSLSEDSLTEILNSLSKVSSDIIKLKVLKQLLFDQSYLDFLDYSPDLMMTEDNFIFLEWVLKTAANLIEAVFPSKCYTLWDEKIVTEAEFIKYKYFDRLAIRILENKPEENKRIVSLLGTYLPHFMCTDYKKARGFLGQFKSLATSADHKDQDLCKLIITNLLYRYFAFTNVDVSDKKNLIKFVAKSPELSPYVNEGDLVTVCDKVSERMNKLGGEFVFDDITKLILKYNRVPTSNEEYAFIMNNIKQLCTARVDENLILDIFPLNFIIQEENKVRRHTMDLHTSLEVHGMFDYSTVVKELFEKMESVNTVYNKMHKIILGE